MSRLIQCLNNPNHWYCDHTSECPWCILASQTGQDPFPEDVAESHTDKKPFAFGSQVTAPSADEKKNQRVPIDYRRFNSTLIISSILFLCMIIIIGVIISTSWFNPEKPDSGIIKKESFTSPPLVAHSEKSSNKENDAKSFPSPPVTLKDSEKKSQNEHPSFLIESNPPHTLVPTPEHPSSKKSTNQNPISSQIIVPGSSQIQPVSPSLPTTVVTNEPTPPLERAPGTDKITIETMDSGPFVWGGDISFSGENSISDTVYLFFVRTKGKDTNVMYNLNLPPNPISVSTPDSFTSVPVHTDDNTWTYTWNISADELERTVCKVYAISSPADYSNIEHIPHGNTDAIIIGAKPLPKPDLVAVADSSSGDSF